MRTLSAITSALALCACATSAAEPFQNTFVAMTSSPENILEFLSEMHEVNLGGKTEIKLFLAYSYAEPDQQSYLQVSNVLDIPGEDSVAVYDLEANLGKELWITGVSAKDENTLEIFDKDETILIRIDGLAAESK